MRKNGLSQEGLKLIACLAMLIDHIGAILLVAAIRAVEGSVSVEMLRFYYFLRCIGRIAFPIFCFQLAEGAFYTRNPKKYALRLGICAVLSEIPFDLAFSGKLTWARSNVMITLLLGFCMIQCMNRVPKIWKLAVIAPFWWLANKLHTDYAGGGILLIAMFALVRDTDYSNLLRLLGMIGWILLTGDKISYVQNMPFYLGRCKLLALLPIFAYDGRKTTRSKAVQWGFYLFYPVHILVLYLIKKAVFG